MKLMIRVDKPIGAPQALTSIHADDPRFGELGIKLLIKDKWHLVPWSNVVEVISGTDLDMDALAAEPKRGPGRPPKQA